MKKKMLSIVLTFCLLFSLVPAVHAADTSGLQSLIDNAADGATISLQQDYVLTDTVTISKGLTINGNNHSITYNGSESAINVTATAAVALNGTTINATSNGARGINVATQQMNITLTGCTLNVHNRGINIYVPDPNNDGLALDVSGALTLDNSKILNSQISNYETSATIADTRGISVFRVKNGTITLKNSSEIKGFGYSINTSSDLEGDVRLSGTTYDISDSTIWGWSALNIWTVGNEFNISNSDIRGINSATGGTNSFSTIVLNENIYGSAPDATDPNTFNITGGIFMAIATQELDIIEWE